MICTHLDPRKLIHPVNCIMMTSDALGFDLRKMGQTERQRRFPKNKKHIEDRENSV